jgi:ribosome-binding protein aMBF1 (putative translation factor)
MAAADDDALYRPLFLTWQLLQPTRAAPPSSAPTSAAAAAEPPLRQRVQTARIERRWTVAELAQRVRVDEETLAAFERGDEVLASELQRRLRQALDLG